MNRDNLKTFN